MLTDIILKAVQKDPTVKRHLLKTISWRIIGTIDTMLLGWLVTGQLRIGAAIGGLELVTKMLLYFAHERTWHRISFGLPSRAYRAAQVQEHNVANLFEQKGSISRQQREALNGSRAFTIWLTGLSGAGKSTIASGLDTWFYSNGLHAYVIDGDNTRLGINSDLSFSNEDRTENIRRVAEMCKLFNDAGIIVISSFISPFEADRQTAKKIIGSDSFIETFIDASLSTCRSRDPKGLYKLADEGKIKDFTGISSPYQPPAAPHIHLHTDQLSVQESTAKIIAYLQTAHLATTTDKQFPL